MCRLSVVAALVLRTVLALQPITRARRSIAWVTMTNWNHRWDNLLFMFENAKGKFDGKFGVPVIGF